MDWRIWLPYSMMVFWAIVLSVMAVHHGWQLYNRVFWHRRVWRWAEQIMTRAELGSADDDMLLRNRMTMDGQLIGWLEMVSVYRKYITSLPISQRHDLIERLIGNQQRRQRDTGKPCTDLVQLVSTMNAVEKETVIYACGGFHTLDEKGSLVKIAPADPNEIANQIIMFRFRNPY